MGVAHAEAEERKQLRESLDSFIGELRTALVTSGIMVTPLARHERPTMLCFCQENYDGRFGSDRD
jgi:hypothetical protein